MGAQEAAAKVQSQYNPDERAGRLRPLPSILTANDVTENGMYEDLVHFWHKQRHSLDALLHKDGAVLFRGFNVVGQVMFEDMISSMGLKSLDYVDGNSPRKKLASGVYTSTEYPAQYFISLHNELSYCAEWPARLFFCCERPAEQGGQTPLVDSRALLQALPKEIVDEFRAKQVKYVRNLHGGRGVGPSWQDTFETHDPEVVENYAGISGNIVEWQPDQSLRFWCTRPATAVHPTTGEEVWFNQAEQFHPSTLPKAVYESMTEIFAGHTEKLPQNAYFGDGTEIPLPYFQTIRSVTDNLRTSFDWQRGDLLMVDNMLVAHGRMPFKGERRILVSMTGN